MAAPGFASAQPDSQKVALYANVGADLTHYDVDVAAAELTKRETVTLPAAVQYAWPHASRRYLYVATSSSAPGYGTQGTEHHVTAFAIDPSTGALTPHGAPITLPARPIHISTDIPSAYILVAFNNPSAVRVYRIIPDFTSGDRRRRCGPSARRRIQTRCKPRPAQSRSSAPRRHPADGSGGSRIPPRA